jgi:hypothetical protein
MRQRNLRDASKQNLAEKADASKLKTWPKTILVPPECGTNEVRDKNKTGDL